ncbi:MAG TPA: outer membrane protein assembly factor BamC [Rhodocyclaceae bacterium]|nr:outer membrane protein assembly factor BamC [Rhodocyclaceae bacterium]
MKSKASVIPLLAMAGVVGLAGCSSSLLESKKIDYKSAGKLPPLEIPPDLTAPGRDERFTVPDSGVGKGGATFSVYSAERDGKNRTTTAQDVLPAAEGGKIHIERSGTQRWLVVPMTPDKLWPSIKEFWQDTGFIVNVERPEAGVMETDWAENRAKLPNDIIRGSLGKIFDDLYSTAERDKFRTRIEAGAEPGTTEIYISHRGMYEVYTNERSNETRWQPRPADPDLEAEMLRRLMSRLGVEEAKADAMLAAGPVLDRAKLVGRSADGSGSLELQEPFDRAWRRVGLALDRVGFTVEDRDRAQGVYYVRYVDPEADSKKSGEDKGFMNKLMFWKGSGNNPDASPRYRISVQNSGSLSKIQVLNKDGGVEASDTSRKILNLLFEQLK